MTTPARHDPIAAPLHEVGVWNAANIVTMARLLLVPAFGILLAQHAGHDDSWRYWAAGVFTVASASDRLDGELARRRNLITDFGKIADPIADKALMGTALVILSALRALPWWVTAVVLVRELGITLLRFWVIRRGVIAASRGGKVKTLLQSIAIGLYVLPLDGWLGTARWCVMVIALVLTVVTGGDYVLRAVRLRRTRPVTVTAEPASGMPGVKAPGEPRQDR